MKLKTIVLSLAAVMTSSAVLAHGYINEPAGRNFSCKLGDNKNCGNVIWEPQSLEAPSGFPEKGPADGKLASAAVVNFAPLDEQSHDRWFKRDMKPGLNKISWFFTANHVTKNWRYYITKKDWNPNQVLTRDSFELTPFCVVDGGMVQPPKNVTHECNVPERTGYQVIYGVWEVGDTSNSFYNVIDVMFDDNGTEVPPSIWEKTVGTIQPMENLVVGESVTARIFTDKGEVTADAVEVVINSEKEGDKNAWSHALATKINEKHSDIRAGVKNAEGEVVPAYGQNTIYVKKGSKVERVEIKVNKKEEEVKESFKVSGLQHEYQIKDGAVTIKFDVAVEGKLAIEATAIDHHQNAKGYDSATVQDSTHSFTIELKDVSEGHHMLIVKAKNDQGKPTQETLDFHLLKETTEGGEGGEEGGEGGEEGGNGEYEFVFPEGLKQYKAGTLVFQPKTNKVYECKAFPFSGYCVQWTKGATHFEPGTGSHWQQAWTEK